VFMDVQMAVLDGYEATRRIRSEVGLADLPIIAVTAGALSSERKRAEEAGMNDFICKPFDGQSLARSILRHVRPHDPPHAAPTPAPFAPPRPADVDWPAVDGIDSDDARARWCGDASLFISMLKRLFEEFGHVGTSDAGQDSGAIQQHARVMHKLRGAACMLGARSIGDVAGQIEAACIARDTDRVSQLTNALADELQRVLTSAQPLFSSARPAHTTTDPVCASGAELAPELIEELRKLLRQQSLAALDRVEHLGPQLRPILGEASYNRLRHHIDNLEFEEASRHLSANTQRRNPPTADCRPSVMEMEN